MKNLTLIELNQVAGGENSLTNSSMDITDATVLCTDRSLNHRSNFTLVETSEDGFMSTYILHCPD